ncbi:MAG TPA: 30S ribosomal protein S20 [Chlamydiales bacterium]|nr:30S ribosomal protein S20 [Chlamydiales bacterium]
MAEETKKKPKKPTALKREIQNEKKKKNNKAFKSQVHTAMRSLKEAHGQKENEEILKEKLSTVYSLLDKGVKKHIFKKNKAARLKSKYSSL